MTGPKPETDLSDGRVELRLVRESDARQIVELRNAPKGQILPRGAVSENEQVVWIRNYRVRENAGTECYFAIQLDGVPVGFVRVYSIDRTKGVFSWGSWVIREGTPSFVSLVSVRLVYDFAFETLGLTRAEFDVRIRNRNVLLFHFQMGAIEIRRTAEDVFFEYSAAQYRLHRTRLSWLIDALSVSKI